MARKFKKDYYGGALMVLIGAGSYSGGLNYHIGDLAHMGPGYFPAALGIIMMLTGIVIAAMAVGDKKVEEEVPIGQHSKIPDLRGGIFIILSVLAFIAVGEYGGLLPATIVCVFVAAMGDRDNTVVKSLILAAAMGVIAIVVFWWLLQLQLPLFQWGG